jgi:hypothetical protein
MAVCVCVCVCAQAGECRKADQIEANLVKAMKAAITDGARTRIVSVLEMNRARVFVL